MPDSYSFLVRHASLWWLSYMFMQPKVETPSSES